MSRDLLSLAALLLACACAAETSELPSDDSPAASGSGGKKSGTGGSLASSGKTSNAGGEPDDTPSGGGESSEDGGSSSTGGASSSGGKSSGGSGGKGTSGSGSGGSTTGEGWKFPTNAENWAASYGEPGSLMGSSSVSWDSAAGNPDNGSLKLTIPFNGTDQKLDVSVAVASFNLTGKTITAKVKLDSGLSSSPDNPGGAKLYVKTSDKFIYADSGWTNLDGNWATVTLNVSAPAGYVAGTHTPSDVREIGVEIATGSQGSYSSATVHVDTVIY